MSTNNPGKKADTGKAPVEQGFVQYFPRAIEAVALVSAYGAQKYEVPYSDKSWERVENGLGRYADGRSRHITGEYKDGPHDPESKLLHAAHAAWNSMAYLELVLRAGAPLVQPVEQLQWTAPPGWVGLTEQELEAVRVAADAIASAGSMSLFDDPVCKCGAKASYGIKHLVNCEHYVVPPTGVMHECLAGGMQRGYSAECEKCKTATYGPRVI